VPHRLRLLTHEVTLDAPAGLAADRVALLAGTADHTRIPLLCRTAYRLRSAGDRIELLEDGATFATAPTLDDAVTALDRRIRLRVFDLAARSGWLPLDAGLAVRGDRTWLLVGGAPAERASLLAQLVDDGAGAGTAEFALVRSGSAVGYPRPVWLPTSSGRVRSLDPGVEPALSPRPLTGIVLLSDDAGGPAAAGSSVATGALLAARVETGVRAPGADVAAIAAVLRRVEEVLAAGRRPETWSGVRSRIRAG
jgi:hypothetical protein